MSIEPFAVPPFAVKIGDGEYVAEIGVVNSFSLEREDHGLFTAVLIMSFGGGAQALGPVALDGWSDAEQRRVGTAFGLEYLVELVERVGSPEKAKGRRVVAFRRELYGRIEGIATLADDGSIGEPFMPEDLHQHYYPKVRP